MTRIAKAKPTIFKSYPKEYLHGGRAGNCSRQEAESYTGPINISTYLGFDWLRDQLKNEGVNITIPAGN